MKEITFGDLPPPSCLSVTAENVGLMKELTPTKKEQMCSFYDQGESTKSLSNIFGINSGDISRILRKSGVRTRSISEANKLAYALGRRVPIYSRIHIPETARRLTPAKAYILGVVGPGDGCVVNTKKRNVCLKATDINFVKEFSRCIKKVYGLTYEPSMHESRGGGIVPKSGNYKPMYEVQLSSKEVVRDVLRYGELKDFKHHTERVPEEIKRASLDIKSSYLRAFFDSQGHVVYTGSGKTVRRKITATKANREVLEELGELLLAFNIKWQIRPASNKSWQVVITGRNSIQSFSERIGFTIERKKRVLNESLKSYKNWVTSPIVVDRLTPQMKKLRQDGFSYKWIAKTLGLSVSTVWLRLTEAES